MFYSTKIKIHQVSSRFLVIVANVVDRYPFSDPYPHGSALVLVGWIRTQVEKNNLQKRKKVKKCIGFKFRDKYIAVF